jgi:S-adenosylmethionine decarboxylase
MEHTSSDMLDTVIQLPGTQPVIETDYSEGGESEDHFVTRDGIQFAGTHLILDLWDAKHLDELDTMEQAMREAISVSGATLLHIHLHHFTPNGGITGVAVLAESHISVHTWPERDYAAFDIFMCGHAKPEMSIAVFQQHFFPGRMEITEHLRGIIRR